MNSQNAHQYLPLVQALADGKTLQIQNSQGWIDLTDELNFVFDPEEYRIKPELRTFKLYIIDTVNGEPVLTTHPTMDHRWKQIMVQEVAE